MGFNFYMPVQIISGQGVVRQHGKTIAGLGRRCLIVTDAAVAKASGALQDIEKISEEYGIACQVYDKVQPNPAVGDCWECGRQAAGFGAEFLIGIGGGSPMDAAKAAAVFAANPGMRPMDIFDKKSVPSLPTVLLGTTAGTGSEASCYCILTDENGKKKNCGIPAMFAKYAFGDINYMKSLPYAVTVGTALDAVTHAMEGYFNKNANDFSDKLALDAMRALVPGLEALRTRPEEIPLSLRQQLYEGSIYGGMVLGIASTVFGHKMGYYLSEAFHVPHGFACAVFLPELFRLAQTEMPDKLQALCNELGYTDSYLVQLFRDLTEADIPPIPEATLDFLIESWRGNSSFAITPGDFDEETQRDVFRRTLKVVSPQG